MTYKVSIGLSLALSFAQPAFSQVLPSSSVVFAIRVYQRLGASHIDWMGLTPASRQPVKWSGAEKNECIRGHPTFPISIGAPSRTAGVVAKPGHEPAFVNLTRTLHFAS
jgi:hypothetical protein